MLSFFSDIMCIQIVHRVHRYHFSVCLCRSAGAACVWCMCAKVVRAFMILTNNMFITARICVCKEFTHRKSQYSQHLPLNSMHCSEKKVEIEKNTTFLGNHFEFLAIWSHFSG